MTAEQAAIETIRQGVHHMARGCRSNHSHDPQFSEKAIDDALAALVARNQKLEGFRDEYERQLQEWVERTGQAEARSQQLEQALTRIANIGDPVDGMRVSPVAQEIARAALARAAGSQPQETP